MNLNINKIRNATIDATVDLLAKAKAKEPSFGEEVRTILDEATLTSEGQVRILNAIQAEFESFDA